MTRWWKRAICLLGSSAALGLSLTSAFASQTFNGALCQPGQGGVPGDISYRQQLGVINAGAASLIIVCPTTVDHDIGNARWTFRVEDLTSGGGFACGGAVYDSNGNLIANTPIASTSAGFTGLTTLTASTTSGGWSSTFYHELVCGIPNNASNLRRITLD